MVRNKLGNSSDINDSDNKSQENISLVKTLHSFRMSYFFSCIFLNYF